jgi:hypothetical protein
MSLDVFIQINHRLRSLFKSLRALREKLFRAKQAKDIKKVAEKYLLIAT